METPEPTVRMVIHLAEGDPFAAQLEEYFLRTEGYEVLVTFRSQDARHRAEEGGLDLAVCEVLMSGAGLDLCLELKDRGVPAILAISSLDVHEQALASCADAFLKKPFHPLVLVSTVKDLLGVSAFLRRGEAT